MKGGEDGIDGSGGNTLKDGTTKLERFTLDDAASSMKKCAKITFISAFVDLLTKYLLVEKSSTVADVVVALPRVRLTLPILAMLWKFVYAAAIWHFGQLLTFRSDQDAAQLGAEMSVLIDAAYRIAAPVWRR